MDSPYLAKIKAANTLLINDVARLSDDDMPAPTLLPGWDRAMLLTHVAANGEGALRAVTAAMQGQVGEIYPGGTPAREAEIEAGRGKSADELKERVSRSAEELTTALQTAPDEIWRAKAIHPKGEVEIGPGIVIGRLREVMVHHVDLLVGYTPRDWNTAWLMEEMDRAMLDLPGRLPEGTAVVLHATDLGQRWVAGSGQETEISGTMAELLHG